MKELDLIMKTTTSIEQPPVNDWEFIEAMKQPLCRKTRWNRQTVKPTEVSLMTGVSFELDFPDDEHILETAYNDLDNFLQSAGVGAGTFKIITGIITTAIPETYRITVTDDSCRIEAGDTEGIRRAIYFIEDELLRNDGPFLEKGVIERHPVIKSRISRCFFGPLKRPPFYVDELLDETDYYPAEYLNRLAYEGVNGLWLTISFKELARTSFAPQDEHAMQRLAKLAQIVEKCRQYGIKIYIFCIEPIAFDPNDPILKKYPELGGNRTAGKVGFCPSSKTAIAYLRTAVRSIFEQVEHLGGMIVLSVGEWHTLCCNIWGGNNCPICSKIPKWESLAKSLGAMETGMREVAPEAELISWPYGQPALWGMDESIEASSHLPENVILMHNFESYGGETQLGKYREISDYWLSYIGPSNFFTECAKRAKLQQTKMFAKLQVACSHEVATTQYVPVPGNLYKKYQRMHELGVSGVMQCWYFGAYPSLMTKAAGELAFAPFPKTEDDFLLHLAKINWGSYASQIVKAWKIFSESYDNYPLTNVMGYVGPMHDGIVWPLHLEPVYRRMTPSWRLDWPVAGDRVGECIKELTAKDSDFSLDEIILLLTRMADKWHEGVTIMTQLEPYFSDDIERLKELGIAEALGLLFRSGLNIFKFYQLRETLPNHDATQQQQSEILEAMKIIVNEEIENSTRMVVLSEQDASLGFHSEAEGYRFTPEKIKARIELLQQLLAVEFPRVAARINKHQQPFVLPDDAQTVQCYKFTQSPQPADWQQIDFQKIVHSGQRQVRYQGAYPGVFFEPHLNNHDTAYWKAGYDNQALYFCCQADNIKQGDSFKLEIETDRLSWHQEFIVGIDGKLSHSQMQGDKPEFQAKVTTFENSWQVLVTIPFATLKVSDIFSDLRVNVIRAYLNDDESSSLNSWLEPHPLRAIFILGDHNPMDLAWLIPNDNS
jgi:hypothetical protein